MSSYLNLQVPVGKVIYSRYSYYRDATFVIKLDMNISGLFMAAYISMPQIVITKIIYVTFHIYASANLIGTRT